MLQLATKHIQSVAAGDFTKPTPPEYLQMKDEIGILAQSVDTMQSSLKKLIQGVMDASVNIVERSTHVNQTISELNAGIQEISYTTETLSAGMEETAATCEEMNATIFEVGGTVQILATKAQNGAASSEEIDQRANELKTNALISQQKANQLYATAETDLKASISQSKAVTQISELSQAILQIASQTTCSL